MTRAQGKHREFGINWSVATLDYRLHVLPMKGVSFDSRCKISVILENIRARLPQVSASVQSPLCYDAINIALSLV